MIRICELGKDCDVIVITQRKAYVLFVSESHHVKALRSILGMQRLVRKSNTERHLFRLVARRIKQGMRRSMKEGRIYTAEKT